MKLHQYYVYILTNKNNAVLYIGVTNDVKNRVLEHKNGLNEGFTKKYQCNKLVYFEAYQWIDEAIAREKQLKNWHKDWKINLIKTTNPDLLDLKDQLDT